MSSLVSSFPESQIPESQSAPESFSRRLEKNPEKFIAGQMLRQATLTKSGYESLQPRPPTAPAPGTHFGTPSPSPRRNFGPAREVRNEVAIADEWRKRFSELCLPKAEPTPKSARQPGDRLVGLRDWDTPYELHDNWVTCLPRASGNWVHNPSPREKARPWTRDVDIRPQRVEFDSHSMELGAACARLVSEVSAHCANVSRDTSWPCTKVKVWFGAHEYPLTMTALYGCLAMRLSATELASRLTRFVKADLPATDRIALCSNLVYPQRPAGFALE
jgi:hypothetical protein